MVVPIPYSPQQTESGSLKAAAEGAGGFPARACCDARLEVLRTYYFVGGDDGRRHHDIAFLAVEGIAACEIGHMSE